MKSTRHQQRGVGLLDGMVALAILAFGLLALTRFQSKLIAQATESQHRLAASQLADELLNTVLMSNSTSRICYTLPSAGPCTDASAAAFANTWQTRVAAALPNAAVPVITQLGNGRFTVTLQWRWASKDGSGDAGEQRTHTVTTDWR